MRPLFASFALLARSLAGPCAVNLCPSSSALDCGGGAGPDGASLLGGDAASRCCAFGLAEGAAGAPVEGAMYLQQLLANTYSSSGAGVCCALGYWSAKYSDVCNSCPAGTFTDTPGSAVCAACPAELGSYPGATRCFPSILAAGSCLNAGDALVDSCSGSHLAMEGNGNLVLYDSDMSVVLNFSTAPLGARACMYTSGNFAVLDGSGSVVWSMSPGLGTPAFTPGSGVYLILQWDHSLMAYDGTNNLLATVYSGLGVGRLFSTGVDASGHLLQEGDSDPHYLYACCGNSYAYSPDVHAFTPFIFRYFADHPNWIYDYTVSGDAHSIYRTTFTATPAHSVHVTADCDDDCTLWLNNVQVGSSGGFWSQNGTISLNLNGLKCGLNTLEARVHNLPGVGPSGVAIVATYLNAVPCAAGSFASGTGSLYCTPCPAGTWASATGANSSAICKPCPAGTWSSATGANSAASCKPCPSGSFCPQFSTIPHNCPAPLTCSTSTLSDCGLLVNNGSFDLNGLFYYDLGFDSFCLQPSSTYLPSSNYEVKLYRANTGVSITVTASVVSNPFSNTVLYLISDNSDWGSYVPDCSTLADSPSLLLTARGISINNRVTLPYGYGMLGCFSTDDSEPTVPGGAYLAIEYAYCTAGSYCPYGTVQGNETLCPPGTFSLDGAAVCTPCPAGTWSSATGATFSLNEATVCTPCGCPSSCLAGATADVSSCSATPTFSPTRSPSPSVTVTPSATPSPLACAPGSFVAPGTYFCSRCPANSIAPYAGPTTSCDPCPRPLVANVNATSCAFCPLHMRTNGTACAPCPADMWCESGRELPCLVPGQCLGDLQGCRAGHIGFLCGSCAPHFYKAPTNFCAPCGVEMWQALAWIGGAAAVAAAVTFLFYQQLREVVKGLLVVHNEHDARLSLLWDQVVRLALLNRLSVLPLPAEFKWALSFVGLVVGFNTATSATECASVGWAFAQKWGLVVGSVFGAMALALCADLYMRRTGNAIAIADWRVWDAMDVFIPLAVQACWQAMSSVAIDGKARLLSEPETLFDLYPHYYIYCASVTIVVINVFFILLRSWPVLGCEQFRRLARDEERKEYIVVSPAPEELAALRRFSLARRVVSFLRSVAILLQMYGAAVTGWWLIGVSTLEIVLLASNWRALQRGEVARWDARSTLLLVFVFLFTHGAGVGCLARGSEGCTDLGWLGAVIVFVNVALFAWLAVPPCRGAVTVLCTDATEGAKLPPLQLRVAVQQPGAGAAASGAGKAVSSSPRPPVAPVPAAAPVQAGSSAGSGATDPASPAPTADTSDAGAEVPAEERSPVETSDVCTELPVEERSPPAEALELPGHVL